MSDRILNRGAALVIAKSSRDRYFVTTDELRVEGLRIAFTIERTLKPEPNPATITVYNLSESSRALLRERPLSVTLEAGYDGQLARAFSGDVTFATTDHEGPDLVTKIQAGDGARALRGARVNRTFRAGTDARTAVKELAGSMGLNIPTSLAEVDELRAQFASGISLEGPSHAEMTRLLKSKGIDWSVQDGSLAVYRARDHRNDPPILFTTEAGERLTEGLRIIGSPQEGAPTKETKVPSLRFKAQLYPQLVPGMRVELRSREVRGVFRAERVSHTGDTASGEWCTEVEAKPL